MCALQLTRTVAMDFNNALTSILGHTSLLLNKIGADESHRDSLEQIERSISRRSVGTKRTCSPLLRAI